MNSYINQKLKGFFIWLYFNDVDWYGNKVKMIKIYSLSAFLIDMNFQRQVVSPVWDKARIKCFFNRFMRIEDIKKERN